MLLSQDEILGYALLGSLSIWVTHSAYLLWKTRKINCELRMEAEGVGVYISLKDRIKYSLKKASSDIEKKYQPIPGVRYTPHWYLKDPLPRNVRPKPLPLVRTTDSIIQAGKYGQHDGDKFWIDEYGNPVLRLNNQVVEVVHPYY